MPSDYYQTLGVRRDATSEEIRDAYRLLTRKNHPDVNTDRPIKETNEIMSQINEAYGVLSNFAKRSEYDATLPVANSSKEGNKRLYNDLFNSLIKNIADNLTQDFGYKKEKNYF